MNSSWISEESKQKIIKAVKKVPVKAIEQSDWSRLIEFKLWWKMYKILDVNVLEHSDEAFLEENVYIYQNRKKWVNIEWMLWNDVENWRNKKLKKYIKDKEKVWLYMPKPEEMVRFLKELWNLAWLDKELDQIAMLAYLTWMSWDYWLQAMDTDYSRALISCHSWSYFITSNASQKYSAYLCLMSLDR